MSPAHLPNQPLSMIVAIYKAGGKEGNSWYHTGESPATLTVAYGNIVLNLIDKQKLNHENPSVKYS